MDEIKFWYYNTTDPLAEPRPWLTENEEWVQHKAARSLDYLIIFEASSYVINEANRIHHELAYEEYVEDMTEPDVLRGLVVDGLFVPSYNVDGESVG